MKHFAILGPGFCSNFPWDLKDGNTGKSMFDICIFYLTGHPSCSPLYKNSTGYCAAGK